MERKKPSAIAKVPQEWVEQLEKIAKQTGQSVNDLVREAIAQYLGIDKSCLANSSNLEKDFERLNADLVTYKIQLDELNQKVNALSSYSQLVTTLQMRLTSLEEKVGQNNSNKAIATTSFEVIEEEEDCDEPDEILFDFLPRGE